MSDSAERLCILVADDDPSITEALALILERPGRTVIVCSDIESAEMCLERYPVTHLLSDVQFSGPFGYEGLHFLQKIRTVAPHCRIVLMTGAATDALRASALAGGAAAVLRKPFDADELEAALATPADEPDTGAADVVRVRSLDEIIDGGVIIPAFQPIVRISGAEIIGWEALTRLMERWIPDAPSTLFEYASRRSRLADLNLAAMTSAIAEAAALPAEGDLFMNVDPLALQELRIVGALEQATQAAGIAPARVVVEITERSAFSDCRAAQKTVDALRDLGVRFAFDDHGSAYSHLSLIDAIRPSFIKISQHFGTGFEADETKGRVVRSVVSLARDFGCDTIIEGVETRQTADAAVDLGITHAQGFFFGRPQPAASWRPPDPHRDAA